MEEPPFSLMTLCIYLVSFEPPKGIDGLHRSVRYQHISHRHWPEMTYINFPWPDSKERNPITLFFRSQCPHETVLSSF
jgi:hypothetical protein